MDTHKTIVLKKLYENSHIHPTSTTPLISKGDISVKELSHLTGFTIPLVKNAITALGKLKAMQVEPKHDINNLDKIMSFIIFLNRPACDFLKKDQGGVS